MEEWQPVARDEDIRQFSPFPIRTLSCFNASAALCMLVTYSPRF
jgi:hypothetical protein